jgi:hypothetical protein
VPDAAPRQLSHEEVVEFSRATAGPVAYAIGTVDPRFDLSEERLRELVREAAAVWEGPAGRSLFREDATARLKVNLVFDERQQRRVDENRLRSDIEESDTSRKVLIGDYDTERALAGRLEEDYKADAASLSRRIDVYNAAVASWNARGGAPPDELARLHAEQGEIATATDAVERKRRRLNEVLDDVRSLAESINNLGSRNNREIRDYNGRFGEGREFEKGVYDGSAINIYQFDTDDDLRLTLVHELGHALGFGHAGDPGAVMYYKLAGQPMNPIRLAAEDLKLLNERNQGAVAGRTP